jgi:hypothetical protein
VAAGTALAEKAEAADDGGKEGGKEGGQQEGGAKGKEGGKEGGQQQGGAKKGGRGKAITFPELMCCMWAALGTNEKFSDGKPTPVRLSSFNTAYTQRVKWMKEQDKWRDQHGKSVTEVTPEESIELRVCSRRPPPCLPPLPRVLCLPAAAHLEGLALEGRALHTHDHVTGGICLMIVLHTRNCAFLGEVLVVLKKLAPQNCVSTGIKIFVLWRTKKQQSTMRSREARPAVSGGFEPTKLLRSALVSPTNKA